MVETKTEVRNGMRIDWDVKIPVDDGTLLAADVYRPDDDQPHPVLLAMCPYPKGVPFQVAYANQWNALATEHPEALEGSSNKYQSWEYPDPEQWVPHGYVLVRVDSRGTGGTPGEISFFSARETKDLYDAIEWAGTQSWSNGKVGLSGISYLATNQWHVAALHPPHLAAIAPWEGANDFYREYARSGGLVSEFLPSWMPVQVTPFQYGNPDAPVNPNTGRRVTGDEVVPAEERERLRIDPGVEFNKHPLDDEFYRERSGDLEKITVPLLSAGNWGGVTLHLRGNTEGFMRAASPQKWLEVHGYEHWTEFYTPYGRDLQRQFFDHFLKGEDNGWDAKPPVQLQIRHVDKFVERHETEWPIARTQWTKYYLDPLQKTLSTTPSQASASASYEPRKTKLSFRTAPFSAETEMTGPVVLKLFVSSATSDADIFATVSLFDPDGNEVLYPSAMEPKAPLTQGWLRLSQRRTDPDRSLPYRPWHSHDTTEKLMPWQVYEVEVEVWPTSIVIPQGYVLALTVEGTDYNHGLPDPKYHYGRPQTGSGPYWHEHPGDRDKPEYDGTVTISTEPGREPYLLMPVIPEGPESPDREDIARS
jgi:predicted acyl esterase